MPDGPVIAVPHWRAPTWERTKYYYDALEAGRARHAIVDGDDLPSEARGLLLTGGVDVDPHLYGEKRGPKTDRPNKQRDAHELRLLRQALDRDIPVLCICRGHELLNVALGGSLLQHIEDNGHRWYDNGSSNWHEVTVDGDSRLAAVYGEGSVLRVNSRHHQGVTLDRIAGSLRPSACSPDGFVEAMESTQHPWVLGVQWHPERPEPDLEPTTRQHWDTASVSMWQAFIEACSAD